MYAPDAAAWLGAVGRSLTQERRTRQSRCLRCGLPFAFLEPVGQCLILDTVECGEARAAQAAGLKGVHHGRSLFRGITEPAAPVRFQDTVIRSSHSPLRYVCYATPARIFRWRYGPRLRRNYDETGPKTRSERGTQKAVITAGYEMPKPQAGMVAGKSSKLATMSICESHTVSIRPATDSREAAWILLFDMGWHANAIGWRAGVILTRSASKKRLTPCNPPRTLLGYFLKNHFQDIVHEHFRLLLCFKTNL